MWAAGRVGKSGPWVGGISKEQSQELEPPRCRRHDENRELGNPARWSSQRGRETRIGEEQKERLSQDLGARAGDEQDKEVASAGRHLEGSCLGGPQCWGCSQTARSAPAGAHRGA